MQCIMSREVASEKNLVFDDTSYATHKECSANDTHGIYPLCRMAKYGYSYTLAPVSYDGDLQNRFWYGMV